MRQRARNTRERMHDHATQHIQQTHTRSSFRVRERVRVKKQGKNTAAKPTKYSQRTAQDRHFWWISLVIYHLMRPCTQGVPTTPIGGCRGVCQAGLEVAPPPGNSLSRLSLSALLCFQCSLSCCSDTPSRLTRNSGVCG